MNSLPFSLLLFSFNTNTIFTHTLLHARRILLDPPLARHLRSSLTWHLGPHAWGVGVQACAAPEVHLAALHAVCLFSTATGIAAQGADPSRPSMQI